MGLDVSQGGQPREPSSSDEDGSAKPVGLPPEAEAVARLAGSDQTVVDERMIPSRDRTAWLARHILPQEPALRAWLHRRRIDGLETDDIVQETYAMLVGLVSVEHIDSPKAYAFQTAQSVILRHLRRARIVRIDAIDDLESLATALDEPSPERQVSARQELSRVTDLIASLPSKCREAFMLRKIDGVSQRGVAQRMGISESTVEKHIGRALRTLMNAMKNGGMSDAEGSLGTDDRDLRTNDTSRNQRGN